MWPLCIISDLRYLISTINATKREGAYLLAGEVEYYRNLDAPMDDNDLTPQLLPAVLFHRAQTPILGLPLSVGWDVTFADFWRREGSTGQVVGLAPDTSLPIPLGSSWSVHRISVSLCRSGRRNRARLYSSRRYSVS